MHPETGETSSENAGAVDANLWYILGHYYHDLRAGAAETARLEGRLAELVNAAYGLTPDEVARLWRTAAAADAGGPGNEGVT
ncbi:MAG: hypothetical protein CVU38_07670 [Chloroflexi bacterium HGW-Chloroflexi-1]|nr:MAG: hypothetical protein CVU38_07670 [Chloroflexi bacterium HGW-Chloroflexi-1]